MPQPIPPKTSTTKSHITHSLKHDRHSYSLALGRSSPHIRSRPTPSKARQATHERLSTPAPSAAHLARTRHGSTPPPPPADTPAATPQAWPDPPTPPSHTAPAPS